MSAISSALKFPITTLRVAITGETNLNMFYDKPLGRHHDVNNLPDKLNSSEYNRIAKAAGEAGIERVLIGGGSAEPLLRKDVPSIVKALCNSKKIPDTRFITNGIFLKDYADALRRSGLKHIEINLDSLNFMVYQKISRRDGLYRVLDGLQKAERIRFESLVLNVILLRGVNEREIIDFAIMTKSRPLHVRFIECQTHENNNTLTRQFHYSLLDAKRTIQDFQALLPTAAVAGAEVYKFKNATGMVSFVTLKDSHLATETPALVLDSQANLFYSHAPSSRSINLLKELEKNSADDKLQKIFQKMMVPAGSNKVLETAVKSAARKSQTRRSPQSIQV